MLPVEAATLANPEAFLSCPWSVIRRPPQFTGAEGTALTERKPGRMCC